MTRLFWIEHGGAGRLAITARPRADDWLDAEVDAWNAAGVDLVVSLLEPSEVSELGLGREADPAVSTSSPFRSPIAACPKMIRRREWRASWPPASMRVARS